MKPIARTAALLLTLSALWLTAAPANARVDVSIGINVPPPAPRVEVLPPPRVGFVWAPGYWRWHHDRHVWVNGHWIKARPGYRWVPERWDHRDNRHHFNSGRWERDPGYHHPVRHHGQGEGRGHNRGDRHEWRR
jgi:hypothetical protein